MKIFQNLYSLILGIIIGLLSSFAAITLGFLALVAVVYTDNDKAKKKQHRFTKTPEPVVPTKEEAKVALSKDDPYFELMYRNTSSKIGILVNDISDHISKNGYVTLGWVYEKIGRKISLADYNRGWTNDEFNINTIEMVDASAGYVTLLLPEPVTNILDHFDSKN